VSHAITPPITVATGSDCAFYRDVAAALRAQPARSAKVFDARGTRLVVAAGGVAVAPNADGADELAGVLRDWLGYMDALRESTAGWSLELLVRASVDHLGFS
jgi:hypothetical protein